MILVLEDRYESFVSIDTKTSVIIAKVISVKFEHIHSEILFNITRKCHVFQSLNFQFSISLGTFFFFQHKENWNISMHIILWKSHGTHYFVQLYLKVVTFNISSQYTNTGNIIHALLLFDNAICYSYLLSPISCVITLTFTTVSQLV